MEEGLPEKVCERKSMGEGSRERVSGKRGMSMEESQLERGLQPEKWL